MFNQETISKYKYWIIGTLVALLGVIVSKISYILNIENNKYFLLSGFFITIVGLFIIAFKLKK